MKLFTRKKMHRCTRLTFLHTPLFLVQNCITVSHLLIKQQNLEFYGGKSKWTKVFLHQNMATSYQRMDIKN